MNLVASLIVRNELGRYLKPCIRSLLTFCDEIRVLDDGSTDGTLEWLAEQDRVSTKPGAPGGFFQHESRARNAALAWAFHAHPTHVLTVDADEFVSDGARLRQVCEEGRNRGVWSLSLREVWKADERRLWTREDGGWQAQERGVPILWLAPRSRQSVTGQWQIPDRKLACGREPAAVRRIRAVDSGVSVLHFGWANVSERAARYQRYVEHDGGKFHQRRHLDSIMWPDSQVRLKRLDWPAGVGRAAILERVRAVKVPA